MARPKKRISAKQVEKLAQIACTVEEIAAFFDCDKRTIERRFAAAIKRGRDYAKASLRRMMWNKAKRGHATMLIFLSKQNALLGFTDRPAQGDSAEPEQPQKTETKYIIKKGEKTSEVSKKEVSENLNDWYDKKSRG